MKEMNIVAAIPGMSLTAEPGSRPWRKPSQLSTVDEAVGFYMPLFEDDNFNTLLIEQIEKGIPLTTISEILVTANVMEGKHSLDVGILVSPVLVESMLTIAEAAGVDAKIGNESELFDTTDSDEEIIRRAIKNSKKSSGDDEIKEELSETPDKETEDDDTVPAKGLMARRSAE
jgi:hypothetical protein